MNLKTLNRKIESKDKIVEATFKLVHSFAKDTSKEYSKALDNYYLVLNKELGIN